MIKAEASVSAHTDGVRKHWLYVLYFNILYWKIFRAVFFNIILLKPDVLAFTSYPSTYEANAA